MARRFSGSIYRHPASSIGNVRNQRLRHGAFLSWTLHVNGGRVENIEAPKGAELEPVFTHLRPNLEIRVSLSWVISGCFIEDVVEADLPDSAFARGDTLLAQATPVFRGRTQQLWRDTTCPAPSRESRPPQLATLSTMEQYAPPWTTPGGLPQLWADRHRSADPVRGGFGEYQSNVSFEHRRRGCVEIFGRDGVFRC